MEFGLRSETADERRWTQMRSSDSAPEASGAASSAAITGSSPHPDHPRLSASICGFIPADRSAISLRLGAALWRFWSIRGHLTEGRASLERLLGAVPAADPELGRSPLRAESLVGAGALAHDPS